MNGNCMHCGAEQGLHRLDTMQCPKGGREASADQKQIWMNTFYAVDNSGEIKELTDLLASAKEIIIEKNAAIMDLKNNKGIHEMLARIADLEAQVARLLEAVPQAGKKVE